MCCAWSFSRVRLSLTPRTAAHQAPLSMGFPRQEYWSGWPCPPPRDLPNPGVKPGSPALQADSLPAELPGFIWKVNRARRWWTSVPKNHLLQVRIQSFILTGEGVKSSLPQPPEEMCSFLFSAAMTRWAWSGYFLRAKQRYVSLALITWEAQFPEMGH